MNAVRVPAPSLQAFAQRFGSGDVWLARAPGRVNLIGDHTDYTEGLVLPMTLGQSTLAVVRRTSGPVRVWSDRYGLAQWTLGDPRPDPLWQRYAYGTAREVAASRTSLGADVYLTGDVPIGAGLSSSASMVVALAMGLAAAWDVDLGETEAALLAQRVEHVDAGVQCGIMDQIAVRSGRTGHALRLDCRTLEVEHVPVEFGVVVVHSDVGRSLAGSAYNDRRAAVERAAAILASRGAIEVASLRDVSPADLEAYGSILPARLRCCARHVVSENARVEAAARALRAGDGLEVGRLMTASHASLRDDYDVSGPELDALVEVALEAGALGARLTGAGFGGCIVARAESDRTEALALEVAERYRERVGFEGEAFVVRDNLEASVAGAVA